MAGRNAFATGLRSLRCAFWGPPASPVVSIPSQTRSIAIEKSAPALNSSLLKPIFSDAAHQSSSEESSQGGFVSSQGGFVSRSTSFPFAPSSTFMKPAAAVFAPLPGSPKRKIYTQARRGPMKKSRSHSSSISFARDFSVGQSIGSGAFGEVFEATRASDGSKKAVKIIPTKLMREQEHEIKMVNRVQIEAERGNRDASNVMNVEAVYTGSQETQVVTDLLAGGELLDYMFDKNCALEELEAAELSKQVLESIKTCHKAGVAHLDVKPENFVFKTPPSPANKWNSRNGLVLIDFGSAAEAGCAHQQGETALERSAGTAAYMAPELLDQKASLASDLWSAGCVSYTMLTGSMAFRTDPHPEDLRSGNFNRTDAAYKKLSPEARSFIETLVHPDPKKRMTVDEALKHDFIKKTAHC